MQRGKRYLSLLLAVLLCLSLLPASALADGEAPAEDTAPEAAEIYEEDAGEPAPEPIAAPEEEEEEPEPAPAAEEEIPAAEVAPEEPASPQEGEPDPMEEPADAEEPSVEPAALTAEGETEEVSFDAADDQASDYHSFSTMAELRAAIDNLTEEDGRWTRCEGTDFVFGDITIPAGFNVDITGDVSATVPAGVTVTVSGELHVMGPMQVYGVLIDDGNISSGGLVGMENVTITADAAGYWVDHHVESESELLAAAAAGYDYPDGFVSRALVFGYVTLDSDLYVGQRSDVCVHGTLDVGYGVTYTNDNCLNIDEGTVYMNGALVNNGWMRVDAGLGGYISLGDPNSYSGSGQIDVCGDRDNDPWYWLRGFDAARFEVEESFSWQDGNGDTFWDHRLRMQDMTHRFRNMDELWAVIDDLQYSGEEERWAEYIGGDAFVFTGSVTIPEDFRIYIHADAEIDSWEAVTVERGELFVNGDLTIVDGGTLTLDGGRLNIGGSLYGDGDVTIQRSGDQDGRVEFQRDVYSESDLTAAAAEAAALPEGWFVRANVLGEITLSGDFTAPRQMALEICGEERDGIMYTGSLTIPAGVALETNDVCCRGGGSMTVAGTLVNEGSLRVMARDGSAVILADPDCYAGGGRIETEGRGEASPEIAFIGLDMSRFAEEFSEEWWEEDEHFWRIQYRPFDSSTQFRTFAELQAIVSAAGAQEDRFQAEFRPMESRDFVFEESITLPENMEIMFWGADSVTIPAGVTVDQHGWFDFDGSLIVNGALNMYSDAAAGSVTGAQNITHADEWNRLWLRRDAEDIGQAVSEAGGLDEGVGIWLDLRSDLTLTQDTELPGNIRLSLDMNDEGDLSRLTIPAGVTLTVNGQLEAQQGVITVNGTLNALGGLRVQGYNGSRLELAQGASFTTGYEWLQAEGPGDMDVDDVLVNVDLSGYVLEWQSEWDDGWSIQYRPAGGATVFHDMAELAAIVAAIPEGEGRFLSFEHAEGVNEFVFTENITIPDGVFLALFSVENVTVAPGVTVTNDGLIVFDGAFDVDGSLVLRGEGRVGVGSIEGESNITFIDNGRVILRRSVPDEASLRQVLAEVGDLPAGIFGEIILENSMTLTQDLTVGGSAHIVVAPDLDEGNGSPNDLTLTVPAGKTLTVDGEIWLEGGVLAVAGALVNNGEIEIYYNGFGEGGTAGRIVLNGGAYSGSGRIRVADGIENALEGLDLTAFRVEQDGGETVYTLNMGPVITRQPEDYTGKLNTTATYSIEAEGDGLSYVWQYKKSDGSWAAWSAMTGYKTANASVTITTARAKNTFRCLVTDKYGNSVASDTVRMIVAPSLSITQQPVDVTGVNGTTYKVSVAAEGEGLTYQWYCKNKNGTSFWASSIKSATYTFKMSDTYDGRQVYCVVTDAYGDTVQSDTVTITKMFPVQITQQPADVTGVSGTTYKVTVAATGEGLTYQWYCKNRTGTSFWASSIKSATYSFKMSDTYDGRQIYCVVTDASGNSVQSDTVTITKITPVTITVQPADFTGKVGDTAAYSITAEGDGLSYLWQYKKSDGSWAAWSAMTGYKTANASVKITEARAKNTFRCVVTDQYGNSVASNTVKMIIAAGPVIMTQPTNITGVSGTTYKVTVAAEGEGLTYQWYCKNKSGSSFWASSIKSATYSFKMSSTYDGRQLYCVVTDASGNTVQSDTVTLYMAMSAAG